MKKNFINPFTLTQLAVSKIKKISTYKKNPNIKFRINIKSGGCNGFQYNFTFELKKKKKDILIQQDEINIIIDSLSIEYLIGGKIDFIENLNESKFIIKNPNATSTCSCGNSFNI
ncbi:iron-sulfur cluster insertion protein ErpA [Buchnera aphidicola]|uniref:iron-sulfur cluster insertion protein ErpA n=1 Tax=Buchnera aphidicola TaxID=9 RepID=UPI0030EE5B1B